MLTHHYSHLGLSADAIAHGGTDHPHDPSDLKRCMDYCVSAGITTDELTRRMSGRSRAWMRLMPQWGRLTELLQHEIDTRTDRSAPLTYNAMRCVLEDGTPCAACDSTGRGVECVACKGTGRRSGGRCRAPRCYRGAVSCPKCHGRGYTGGQR